MAENFQITLSPNFYDLIRRFGAPMELAKALVPVVDRQNQIIVDKTKLKLTGPVLKVQTGRLRKSIGRTGCYAVPSGGGFQLRASVGSNVGFAHGQAVAYAAIHEFGGRTAPHLIVPKKAKALSFSMGGRQVFARAVHHPGSRIPERSYLRSTVREQLPKVTAAIGSATAAFFAGKEAR